MQVGLQLKGHSYESQKVVELKYKDHYVGEGYPDLLVLDGMDKALRKVCISGGEAVLLC